MVGALIVVLAGWAFLRGRTLERAVLPGVLAGFGWWKQQPLAVQGFAGLFSVLTGALGCSGVGYSGVMGLMAGLVLSSAASFVTPRARPGGPR